MTAINHISRPSENQTNFNTLKENRRLRIVEPDYNGGIRNFKYSERKTESLSGNFTVTFLKLTPWIVAGLILLVSIFL